MKFRFPFTVLPFLALALPVDGQNLFAVTYEGSMHLITEVTERDYVIQYNSETVHLPRREVVPFLQGAGAFLPGYLQIEDENANSWDQDEHNRTVADNFYFRYTAKVTANRELKRPFLIFHWVREDSTAYLSATPLDPMKPDQTTQVTLSLFLSHRFRLVEPTIHYMSMGFEIGTSKTVERPVTPYAFALQNASGGGLPDGNLKPLSMLPLPTLKDEEGNPRTGAAHLLMRIDDQGYVSEVEVRDCTEWIFGKTALTVAPFFLFQPRIKDGNPVAAKVLVPFKFQ